MIRNRSVTGNQALRAIGFLLAALTAGCSAYQEGDWPTLNYGDPGAPEIISEDAAAVPPSVVPTAPPPDPAILAAFSDRLIALRNELSDMEESLQGAATALEDAEVGNRGAWFTLQLELSRMNRVDSELSTLAREVETAGPALEGSAFLDLQSEIAAVRNSLSETFARYKQILDDRAA